MKDRLNQIIQFYRDCYQFEFNTEKVQNFFSAKVSHRYYPENFKLLSQPAYQHPVSTEWGEEMAKELALESSEKKLVAGSFFIKGTTRVLGKSRRLFAPLFLQDVNFGKVDETFVVSVDSDSLVLNPVIVGYLNNKYIDQSFKFDELADLLIGNNVPFTFNGLVNLIEKIGGNFPAMDVSLIERRVEEEEARVSDLETVYSGRAESYNDLVYPDVAIGLVDKPVKSKGVINELTDLAKEKIVGGNALDRLFVAKGRSTTGWQKDSDSERSTVPVSLSKQQERILATSKKEPVTVVIGPPGTGKSYSIAALAIEAMHNGNTVLIASKNEQACQVIYDKITRDIGLKGIAVNASKPRFRMSVATRLRNIGNWIGVKYVKPDAYKKLSNEVIMLDGALNRLSSSISSREAVEVKWAKKLLQETTNLIVGIQKKWIAYQHSNNTPIWKLKEKLHKLSEQLIRKKKNLVKVAYQNSLYRLLSNHRMELLKLEQAFLTNRGNEVKGVFESVDFDLILSALPIWICRSADLADILPLKSGLFDLVIIDEASQCDIASSIPLLYRAKSAVVVGDPYQLRHLSFLSRRKEEIIANKYGFEKGELAFRNKSILDIASQAVGNKNAIVFLDEHYRSMPDIIDFSNKKFYDGQLRLMTSHPGTDGLNNLKFIAVKGQRSEQGDNETEASAIIDGVKKIILEEEELGKNSATSIGLISPFRSQVLLMKKLLKKHFDLSEIKKYRILLDTPFGFQGEERDTVFISMVLDDQSHSAAYRYLNRNDVFNVGITRAKFAQSVYYSFTPSEIAEDTLVAQYLANVYEPNVSREESQSYNDFMRAITHHLQELEAGRIYQDRLVSGARLDIVVVQKSRVVGFDLVGFPGEFEEQLSIENIKSLERSGIEVFILPFSSWYLDRTKCKKAISKFLFPKPKE